MKGRHAVLLSGALVLGLVSFPAAAAAQTNEPIAQTGGMETTLPLLGTSLTVGVSLGPTGDMYPCAFLQRKEFWASTFEVGKPVLLVGDDGKQIMATHPEAPRDQLEGVPVF